MRVCLRRLCRWAPRQRRPQVTARTAPAPTSGASSSATGPSWQSAGARPPRCTCGTCSRRSALSRCGSPRAGPAAPFFRLPPERQACAVVATSEQTRGPLVDWHHPTLSMVDEKPENLGCCYAQPPKMDLLPSVAKSCGLLVHTEHRGCGCLATGDGVLGLLVLSTSTGLPDVMHVCFSPTTTEHRAPRRCQGQ